MKPTRGAAGSWLATQTRERKTALVSLTVMLLMMALLVAYQRLTTTSDTPSELHSADQLASTPLPAAVESATAPEPEVKAEPATQTATGALLIRPLSGSRRVLKGFGAVDQSFGDFRLFEGVAFAAGQGEPVLAVAAGKMVLHEQHPLDGTVVLIDHGGGLMSRYAGLGKVIVDTSTAVQAGTIIAQVGEPGAARNALGSHLYLQVLVQGEPVDPLSRFPN